VPDSTEASSRRRSATTAYADLIQLGQMVQNMVPQGLRRPWGSPRQNVAAGP